MTTKTYSPGYDTDDACLTCGEHLSHPHSPGCPAAAADDLRERARRLEHTHEQIMQSGGYTGDCQSPEATPATADHGSINREPAGTSFLLLAAVYRLAAELVEMDQADQTNLDEWETANELVAYLTGEADPFRTDYYQPQIPAGNQCK